MTGPESESSRPSKVETAKAASRYLRGRIAEGLDVETDRFGGDDAQVLKFHGVYQQEDRDVRRAARRSGGDKRYMFMVRSKVPGGVLSSAQYVAHDDLSGTYADGTLRITTRQDFQFHGVLKHDLRTIVAALVDAHITTLGACGDIARNVMLCPAADFSPVGRQIGEIARALSDRLLPQTAAYQEVWLDGERVASLGEEDEPLYGATYLPRKFKIGFASPGDNCIDVYSQDVGFVPIVTGQRLDGFTVLVGGGMGMTHGMEKTYPRVATPLGTVKPEQVPLVTEAIIALHRDYGNRSDRKRARLKYLLDERGVEWVRAEVEARLEWKLGALGTIAPWHVDDHLGWHEQGDGRFYLGVYVENGRVKDRGEERLRSALRVLIDRFATDVRLTPQQNLLLTGIAPGDRATIESILAEYGVRPAETLSPTFRAAMACPALPTCGLALAEAERALPPVIRIIEAELYRLGLADERMSVRMTGCPNGCARPYLGDLGLVGKTAGHYQIFLGGDFEGTRLNELFAELVPEGEVARTLTPLLRAFRDERLPGEGFGGFCNRQGVARLRQRFLPTIQDETSHGALVGAGLDGE